MFYSKSANSFYPESLKEDYIASGTWPEDAEEVSDEIFKTYGTSLPPVGKVRSYQSGNFLWADFIPTREQRELEEKLWATSELQRAGEELNKVQDSDPRAKGTVAAWRAYRCALRSWSESLNFTDRNERPIAPDQIEE